MTGRQNFNHSLVLNYNGFFFDRMICEMGSEILGYDRLRCESYVVIGIYGYKIEELWVQDVIGLRGWKAMGSASPKTYSKNGLTPKPELFFIFVCLCKLFEVMSKVWRDGVKWTLDSVSATP